MPTAKQPETATDAIRHDGRRTGVPVNEPGALRSSAVLTLHTRQAQRLVFGRPASSKQAAIHGLMRWASGLRPLWAGAAKEDPYAEWYLVQIEDAIQTGGETLAALQDNLETRLGSLPTGFKVGLAQATQPYQVDLQFASPHAYQGTYLLATYDRLVCAILTARHIALLDRAETERLLDQGGKVVRRLFGLGQKYRYTGVTREDLTQNNQRAQRALDAMGELPQIILNRELQPTHRPDTNKVVTANEPGTEPDLEPGMALMQSLLSKQVDIPDAKNVDTPRNGAG